MLVHHPFGKLVVAAVSTFTLGALVGCSASSDSGPDSPSSADPMNGDPATPPADPPAANPPFVEAKYPAFPQFVYRGGPIVKNPKFKSVTFAADPNAPAIEDYIAKLAVSSYWANEMAEYQVGPAVAAAPARFGGTPAAAYASNAFVNALETEFAKSGGGIMGVPDPSTIYILTLPAGTTYGLPPEVSPSGGTTCTQAGVGVFGFHSHYKRADNTRITYGVVATCGVGHADVTGIDATTSTISHELAEAASDPYSDAPGWSGMDQDHIVWDLVLGERNTHNEIGDPCDFSASYFTIPTGVPHVAQRMWSNKAAAAGVVCGAPDVGKNVIQKSVPVMKDKVTVKTGTGNQPTLGVKVGIGQSATFDVVLSSDAPTAAWTLEGSGVFNKDQPDPGTTVVLSFDPPQGKNGDVVKATIKLLKVDPLYDAAPFRIVGKDAKGTVISLYIGVAAPS